jgi:hypothetical protein
VSHSKGMVLFNYANRSPVTFRHDSLMLTETFIWVFRAFIKYAPPPAGMVEEMGLQL